MNLPQPSWAFSVPTFSDPTLEASMTLNDVTNWKIEQGEENAVEYMVLYTEKAEVSSKSDGDTSCDDEATGEVSADNDTDSCEDEATGNSTREGPGNVYSDNGAQESVAEMAIPRGPENSTRGGPGDVQTDNGAQKSVVI